MTELIQLQPADEHNLELEANVRPPDWVNPTPAPRYNLVVIGAGTAGLVAAAGAAGLGAKVAIIERSLLGGDCLNVGCVPSKGIISAARIAASARDAGDFGVNVGEVAVDFGAVMARMRRLRAGISMGFRYTARCGWLRVIANGWSICVGTQGGRRLLRVGFRCGRMGGWRTR